MSMTTNFTINKSELKSLIGPGKIFFRDDPEFDETTFLSFGTDRTKVYQPDFNILAFPTTTEEVAKIIKYAYENEISIVPSGGRTGYAGGAIAKNKELVLSLSKMDKVLDFDPFFGSIKVQAGMITKNLHKEAEEKNFYFPVDFASTGSSQIGGNIATNAGGVRVVHYGLIRQWVLGLTVVTGTGEILEFNGEVLKNNTGYDLKQLFIGSEGTLGVITEATLKLTTKPLDSRVLLVAVSDFASILSLFQETHLVKVPLLAFEFFTEYCLGKVKSHLGIPDPFQSPSPYYVLMEFEIADESDDEKLFGFLETITEKGLIVDGSLAQNSRQSETFWKYREGISESISIEYTVHKNDISLPLRNMEPFLVDMKSLLNGKYPGFEIALFGHVGDGNLHLNIIKPKDLSNEDFFKKCKEVDPDMFRLLQKYHGSISAEHGIGLLKKDFLHFSRTQAEIILMKEIKKSMDPKNIMNPGKVF
ncbi:FAD-binding protein [Leptospira interrogans]|nr:FAD-binding oxidoreductase [Leptospira interrogans]APH40694.1 Putative glycolate oxidase, subunit GlcD [Leptospira interrogans serovar Copenhageni/Icterohaemorrhagiae]EMG19279.1 putative glycolate oxidase, subunit GlcD [Leptospira interrogans serovar Copenhageni str. LT2050]ARB97776.1 FAD-binding oxidoreductase [Leptospira interrogans serovar Copenhageni]ASP42982.1 FAD-binding oxidoreductase [Leptospira interrogans]EKP24259.1 putative glycolate oxidase, subunit GlcD [Leptospira interrogans 